MNKNTPKKRNFKEKRNALISVSLVLALLITGIFAFLTATDSKINKFTIGSIDIVLQEYDADGNEWWVKDENGRPTDELTPEVDANDNNIADQLENIIPGQVVDKSPIATNVGNNEEWTFISIGIPTADKNDIIQGENSNGKVVIEGRLDDIPIKAYAVQTNFTDEETETAEGVWAKYVGTNSEDEIDYTNMFGEQVADEELADRIQIFKLWYDSAEGFNDTDWTLIDTYKSSDGNNYYIFSLNELLPADDNTSTEDIIEDNTPVLVDGFKLIEAIGEAIPIAVNYYAEINSSSNVSAGSADLSDLAPVYDGYELVHTTYLNAGESIGDLYYDEDLAKEGFSFDWVDADTNEAAYSNMLINKQTNLLASYSNLELINVIPEEYLVYEIKNDVVSLLGVHASYWEDNPNITECTLIIPSNITIDTTNEFETTNVIKFLGKFQANVTCKVTSAGYIIGNIPGTNPTLPVSKASLTFQPIDTFENMTLRIDTNEIYDNVIFKESDIIKTILINPNIKDFSINTYSSARYTTDHSSNGVYSCSSTVPLEKLVLSYGCTSFKSLSSLPSLNSLDLPNTLTSFHLKSLLPDALMNFPNSLQVLVVDTTLTEFTAPASIRELYIDMPDHSTITFQNTNVTKIIYSRLDSSNIATTPNALSVIYPGSSTEFSENVVVNTHNLSNTSFKRTEIHCTDGIATWDSFDNRTNGTGAHFSIK